MPGEHALTPLRTNPSLFELRLASAVWHAPRHIHPPIIFSAWEAGRIGMTHNVSHTMLWGGSHTGWDTGYAHPGAGSKIGGY